jgi:hypothetical protein
MSPSRKAEQIYERMKQTKSGWNPHDFHTLYLGYGFKMKAGKKHDVFIHPDFPQLRDTIPRHGELGKGYAKDAVANIETLIRLSGKKETANE